MRQEADQKLTFGLHQKQIAAYQTFWSHLAPTSEYCPTEEFDRLLQLDDNGYYLCKARVEKFFDDLNSFFYSEHGIFLSRRMRKALFEIREFYENLLIECEVGDDGRMRLSNKKAERCRQGWHWIRTVARADLGLLDVEFPHQEIRQAEDES